MEKSDLELSDDTFEMVKKLVDLYPLWDYHGIVGLDGAFRVGCHCGERIELKQGSKHVCVCGCQWLFEHPGFMRFWYGEDCYKMLCSKLGDENVDLSDVLENQGHCYCVRGKKSDTDDGLFSLGGNVYGWVQAKVGDIVQSLKHPFVQVEVNELDEHFYIGRVLEDAGAYEKDQSIYISKKPVGIFRKAEVSELVCNPDMGIGALVVCKTTDDRIEVRPAEKQDAESKIFLMHGEYIVYATQVKKPC
ncbi:hypothetical protein ACOJUR_12250 [Alicyclobacillus tolerans]|uniref:hypothetical protein n=1 Tax=Alicyclobacillus tolerans TaxID=90970 RepID=UPI003B7CD5DC